MFLIRVEELLRMAPDNPQAQQIHLAAAYYQREEEKQRTQQLTLGIGAAAAVGFAGVLLFALAGKRKS